MELRYFDLARAEMIRKKSPGRCIYCDDAQSELTDEHVIPYALGANTAIFENASCKACQRVIQKYEQRILRGQLGVFRARIEAPTRRKKDRPTHQRLHFVEVDDLARPIRDLGWRDVPIDEAPLSLSAWELPPPRILGEDTEDQDHVGRPWTYLQRKGSQKDLAMSLARQVASETGSEHVAVKVDQINREDFLRFIVKTAHAFAVFERGIGSFRPLTTDLIRCRSHDLANYIGCDWGESPFEQNLANMTELTIGTVMDGPAKDCIGVRVRLYPALGAPAYIVIVGAPA